MKKTSRGSPRGGQPSINKPDKIFVGLLLKQTQNILCKFRIKSKLFKPGKIWGLGLWLTITAPKHAKKQSCLFMDVYKKNGPGLWNLNPVAKIMLPKFGEMSFKTKLTEK